MVGAERGEESFGGGKGEAKTSCGTWKDHRMRESGEARRS